MKLNFEEIMARASSLYREKKQELGFDDEYTSQLEIRSDQVKALAEALVEAINKSGES